MIQKKRKTGYKKKKWTALLLTGVLLLLGQSVAAKETGNQGSTYSQDVGSWKVIDKEVISATKKENLSEEREANPEGGKVRSRRSASAKGEQLIYTKHYRGSAIQDAYMDLYWDPATKRLRGHSRYATGSLVGNQQIWVGLAREGDKNSSVGKDYPPYTQSFYSLLSNGSTAGKDYGARWNISGGSSKAYQAATGSLLYVAKTSGNFYWNGQRRFDDKMGIAYTEPGAPGDSEHFKILADGTMRKENGSNFLASETTIPYLNTTLKVHENHMAVLGDDFLTATGNINTKIQMRLEAASGDGKFDETTTAGERFYDTFKGIQGIRFANGDKLKIFNYGSQKETAYTYNYSRKAFEIEKNNLPLNTYIIQFAGQDGGAEKGYEFFIENGRIERIAVKGSGIIHSGWSGKAYLSMGIFKSNGDLKKKGTILGGSHTVSGDSQIVGLRGTQLEDGDEIVIYDVKDDSNDESAKVRILGDVQNADAALALFGDKPGFNTKVFRYNATTKILSQEDGTIAGMEGTLKSAVEEKLRELSLNPESNGDKKAWLLGLYSDAQIGFGRKNIQKLTGLEYGVNMRNLSISDNPLKPETYRSLRNLREINLLNIGNIGLKGNEKAMTDILVNLPELRNLNAGYNGLTDVTQFGRLGQPTMELSLQNNNISDISSLLGWVGIGVRKTLTVTDQTITTPPGRTGRRVAYRSPNPIINLNSDHVEGIRDFRPADKGDYDGQAKEVTWSNLEVGKREVSYAFSETLNGTILSMNYTGRVSQTLEVFEDAAVTLEANGGTITAGGFSNPLFLEKGVPAGEKLTPDVLGLTHPQGYRFAGWYRNDAGRGAEVGRDTPINEDMTLYAKWEPPAGEYMIRLNGETAARGYDLILKNGTITSVLLRGGGEILHSTWGGKVYLSMGIFKSNGDLKKKATMLGGDHTIAGTTETGRLQGTVLEDGDEIAIYAAKDVRWDEADKVQIIGDVEGGMQELPGTGNKPGLNTKIFRYNAATEKLSQVDGSIAQMEGALKSTVEEKLEELSLNPESNGNKKAWLLGLYSDAQIGFGNKNIQKLTGLEYGVNMTNMSISDNPLKPETYQSLRNLREVNLLNIGNIGLESNGKAMTDILVSLPGLRTLYAGYNGITDVGEFQQLRQLTDLNLDYNRIRDISPLQDLSTAGLNTLKVNNQNITGPKVEIGTAESYGFTNPLKTLTGAPVQNLTNILPAGKGSFSAADNQITWSGLDTSTTELGYAFEASGELAGAGTNFVFNGQVKIPAKVFNTPKYRLRITADIGGKVKYTIGSKTGTVTSNESAGISKDMNVFEGQDVTLEALPKPDYDLLSWDDGTTTDRKTFAMPGRDTEQRAQFAKKLVVTFNLNGGEWSADGSTGNKELHVSSGAVIGSEMDTPEFTPRHPLGYRFIGWYGNDAGMGAQITKDTPVNQDMNLYAKWEPPVGEYMIELNGTGTTGGYDVILKDGSITSVAPRGKGKVLKSGAGGQVNLSIGIFKSNGDLKKKAAMQGNHTIDGTTEIGKLQGTVLEDGDDMVIYAIKNNSQDSSAKVRVIGSVDEGMPQLPGSGEKPDFNAKVFRYNAGTKKLSQVDGTIAGMEGALKSAVEENLAALSLKPESNGNKKAWLLGLESDEQIGFGRKNIQKLTGLEYAVNMKKVSVSDNSLQPESYGALRNLKEMTELNIGNIGLKDKEKAMTDILVDLPKLRSVYAGHNGITNVGEFGRLNQLTGLDIEYNSIRDISPLKGLSTAGLKGLNANNQSIKEAKVEIGTTESYSFPTPLKKLTGDPVQDITNILPTGKGSFSAADNQVTWSALETSTTELGYDFEDRGALAGAKANYVFSGKVKIPVTVSSSAKYRLRITADVGGAVKYTIGSDTGTITSNASTEASKDIQVSEGQEVILEAVGNSNYDFLSWGDGTTAVKKTFAMPGKEAEQRAQFKKKLTVTFNPNGGGWSTDGSTGNKEVYVSTGAAVGPEMDSAKFAMRHPSGYRFAGWYQTADGTGNAWNLHAPVNKDMTLYANWKESTNGTEGDTPVTYDNSTIIDVDDNGKWGVAIPASLGFTDKKSIVTSDVELVGIDNTDLDTTYSKVEVKGKVTSANGYRLEGSAGSPDATYKMTIDGKVFNANDTAQEFKKAFGLGTAGSGGTPLSKKLNLSAELTKKADAKGQYKDTLLFSFAGTATAVRP